MLWALYLVIYLCFLSCFFFFPSVFSSSLIWNTSPCLLILFTFLCLDEILWESYLSWSGRGVLVREHPRAVCVCPVALVGELDGKWAGVGSSPMVCWELVPWWDVGPDKKGLEPGPGVSWGFFYIQWTSPPYQKCRCVP